VVHLGQSRPAPGGRQLAGQAANLTFESACRLLEAEHSPIATKHRYDHTSPMQLSRSTWQQRTLMHSKQRCSFQAYDSLRSMSNIVKQVVLCVLLLVYLKDNDLLPDRQSAYRSYHSTEMAIYKVLSVGYSARVGF